MLVETPLVPIGLTICYDMRFPISTAALAQAGARLFTVPSAFTVPTGQAHWHVLLRARAIETGSFVLAAAQGGRHESGRETYGHSQSYRHGARCCPKAEPILRSSPPTSILPPPILPAPAFRRSPTTVQSRLKS